MARLSFLLQKKEMVNLTPVPVGLDAILHPIDLDTFFERYWEKRSLHVRRGPSAYHSSLFSLEAADRVLPTLRDADFRVVKEANKQPPEHYTLELPSRSDAVARIIDIDKVLEEYEGGATLLMEGMHRKWVPLASLCREIEKTLYVTTQANVYLTPKASQGFAAHWDTHDVFILQIEGVKRWKLYNTPIELPLPSQSFSPEKLGNIGTPTLDVVVQPGDTLYIPRGLVHEAAAQDNLSLHVTVGVMTYSWLDLLSSLIQRAGKDYVDLRRSVPLRQVEAHESSHFLLEQCQRLLQTIASIADPDRIASLVQEKFINTRVAFRPGRLRSILALSSVNLQTQVRRNTEILCRTSVGEEDITFAFERKQIVFPKYAAAELHFVLTHPGCFIPRAMPGPLDDESKVTLVARLLKEGLLELAETSL